MFAEKITAYYRGLIDSTDPHDPLARLVCFSEEETTIRAGDLADPIGDTLCQCCANGRLIHRYPDRALLLLTDRCAAHCRFCFRRERLSTSEADITAGEIEEVVRYVGDHREIREVVLSGGDPLSLADDYLLAIIGSLKKAGVASVRLHTRYPVYDPSRCETLGKVARALDVIVLHVAHQREITREFLMAVAKLRPAKFLLNQCVLLKGVNDSVQQLVELSSRLGAAGVLPYYLHYPDLAPGISHFRVPLDDAIRLGRALQGSLPGYLIPKLVLDIPGGKGKVLLPVNELGRNASGAFIVESPLTGELLEYRESLSEKTSSFLP